MEYVQRELPYVRSFVLRSVYGVLRQEGITFGEEEPGRVIAEWREDGTDVSLSKTPLQGTGGVRNDGDKMEENARRLVLRFHRHIRRVCKSQHFFGQFCFPGIRHTGVAGNV